MFTQNSGLLLKRKIRWLMAFATVFTILALSGCGGGGSSEESLQTTQSNETISKAMLTPDGHILTPAGTLLSYGSVDTEQHAMDCKLSPDGSLLAVEGKFNLVIVDAKNRKVIKVIPLKEKTEDGKTYYDYGMYKGITWSKDGKHIYLTASTGSYHVPEGAQNLGKIWDINVSDWSMTPLYTFQPENDHPVLPNDIALSEDGNYMYITLNGADKVVKFDIKNKQIVWEAEVGRFPYGVALANGKVYVTDWGGRVPTENDTTQGAGWNSVTGNEQIVVDPETESAASGVVTVLDSETSDFIKQIEVGLHPNAIVASKDGDRVYVANANSDTVSVIDTTNDDIIETISVSPENTPFGSSPTALVLSPDEKYLYVADSMINAVAVVNLGDDGDRSKVVGFIPTAAYPGGLDISKDGNVLYVADTEGLYATATTDNTTDSHFTLFHGPNAGQQSTAGAYNAHRELGYISIIDVPDEDTLDNYTKTTLSDIHFNSLLNNLAALTLPPHEGVKPKPIPDRLGEPSVFHHVIYFIKENRSYDQVFGDMKEGNGDSTLTVFGEEVTPNHHKLAREFLLLDNYYTPAKCSAEGHPWADAAYVDDYIEKNIRTWLKGYYHVMLDDMLAPSSGYIWDNVLNHGLTFRNYGENLIPNGNDTEIGNWTQTYEAYNGWIAKESAENKTIDIVNGTGIDFESNGTITWLVKYSSKHFPAYNGHKIPDVMRAEEFINELKSGVPLANFTMIILPADHTAGVKPGYPTPEAMVADNDLALGEIVDYISHSKYWKDTVIFVTEDDAQNGWDHVSAYRTVGFVISPYSHLHKAVHTRYTMLSMIHTMEQILGIPPMNLYDASAPLMYDCFTDKPDYTPYNYVQNKIPLDELNPPPEKLTGKARYWSEVAETKLSDEIDDDANNEILNKMIWYSTKGYDTPYPEKYVSPDYGNYEDNE